MNSTVKIKKTCEQTKSILVRQLLTYNVLIDNV